MHPWLESHEIVLHLRNGFVRNGQAQLLLCDREIEPKLAPGVKPVLICRSENDKETRALATYSR